MANPTVAAIDEAANNFIADTVTADAKINGVAGTVIDRHGVTTSNLEKVINDGVGDLITAVSDAQTAETNALASALASGNSATASENSAVAAAISALAAEVAKIEWQGAWVTSTTYELSDAIEEAGSSYICIVAHTSGVFATDLANWDLIAQKGLGDLLGANNLSDVASAPTAFNNIKRAATETATGVVEKATTAEAEAGTAVNKFPDVIGMAAAIAALGKPEIGNGQTWQDVKASRAAGTSYQNTTGRSITVSARVSPIDSIDWQVSDDNSTWINVGYVAGGSSANTSFIVSDDWYYRVGSASTTITVWSELR